MQIVQLIIPFIALAIISVMTDRLTLVLQTLLSKVPKLPAEFEWWISYLIVLAISYGVCAEGNFDLFLYFNMNFAQAWEGWLLTALVISGGSTFVKAEFNMIDSIPGIISGITTTIKNTVAPNGKKNQQPESLNEISTPTYNHPVNHSNELSRPSTNVSGSNEIYKDSNRFSDNI